MATVSERLQVILELVTGQYKREAREAATATGQIGKQAGTSVSGVGRLEAGITKLAGPLAVGALVSGLGRLALELGENADRLFDLEAQTGATTDQLQEYEFVAKAAGARTEFFSDSVKQVIRSLDQAVKGTGAVSEAYDKLGVSVLDANGRIRNGADITEDVILRLAEMENITARNALAQDIFGKKWEEVISVLDLGGEAIADLRAEAHELGVVIDKEALVAADRLRENFEKIRAVAGAQVSRAIADVGTNIAAWFGDEASKDLVVYSEALNRINRRMEQGVPAWEAFSEALFRVAEHSDLTSEELIDLASSAGFALDEMTDEAYAQFAADLLAQAEAAGLDAAAVEELRAVLEQTTPEQLALEAAALGGAAALGEEEEAAGGARDRLQELADAQRDANKAFLEAADPAVAAASAMKRYQDAVAARDKVQADSKASAEDLAEAQFQVFETAVEAQAALDEFSAANPQAQIQLIADVLRISDEEARDLLETLNIMDGTQVEVVFNYRTRLSADAAARAAGEDISLPRLPASGRQHGGPVFAGRPYLVGERGRELIIPGASGQVFSNSATERIIAALSGGGRQGSVSVAVNYPQHTGDDVMHGVRYGLALAGLTRFAEVG